MSDEKKAEAHGEWDEKERTGAVQYLSFVATMQLVMTGNYKSLCIALSQHLQEHHGFTKEKAEEEVMNMSAEGLNILVEAILTKGASEAASMRVPASLVQALGAEEFVLKAGARYATTPASDPKKGN